MNIVPVGSTVLSLNGGQRFLQEPVIEANSKCRQMMTLVEVSITVACVLRCKFSWVPSPEGTVKPINIPQR